MRHLISIAVPVILLAVTARASAVTEEIPVTPAYLKQDPKAFSIRAEKRDDGLIHFIITRHTPEPRYMVARFIVRDKGSTVLDVSFPQFVREKAVKYYLAVSPKQLSNAHFELSEHGFGAVGDTPVPWVGGTVYQFRLADFFSEASNTSGK